MEAQTANWEGRSIEKGAVIFSGNCSSCHGDNGEGRIGIAPALNSKFFFAKENGRLAEVGWSGPLKDYVSLTVAAGRPSKTNSQWAGIMPTWSRHFGGPLREDQVDAVVAYVLNWESSAEAQGEGEDPWQPFVVPTAVEGTRSPQELYTAMACQGCHKLDEDQTVDNIGQPGPHQGNLHETAATRVEGVSAEEYVYTSIVEPGAFVVEGYVAGVMPPDFSDKMSEEEINSLVAWILDPNRSYEEEAPADEESTEATAEASDDGSESAEASESADDETETTETTSEPVEEAAAGEVAADVAAEPEAPASDAVAEDANTSDEASAEEAVEEAATEEGAEPAPEEVEPEVTSEEDGSDEAADVPADDTSGAVAADAAVDTNRISVPLNDLYFGETNDNLQNPPVWTVGSGQTYELELLNQSPGVQHSWAVFEKDAVIPAVYNEETDAGSLLFDSGVIEPAVDATISFVAPEEAGDYFVICTVPGHSAVMQGKLVVE